LGWLSVILLWRRAEPTLKVEDTVFSHAPALSVAGSREGYPVKVESGSYAPCVFVVGARWLYPNPFGRAAFIVGLANDVTIAAGAVVEVVVCPVFIRPTATGVATS
jgi:hypothetical protein